LEKHFTEGYSFVEAKSTHWADISICKEDAATSDKKRGLLEDENMFSVEYLTEEPAVIVANKF